MIGNDSEEEEQISEPFEDCGERPSVDRLPAPPISESLKSRGLRNPNYKKNTSNFTQDVVSEPTEDYGEGPITNRLLSPISGKKAPAGRSSRISVGAMEREKKAAAAGLQEGSYRLQRLKPPERMTPVPTRQKKKDDINMEGSLSSRGEDQHFNAHLLENNRNESSWSNSLSNIIMPGKSTARKHDDLSAAPITKSSKMSVTEMEQEKKNSVPGFKGGSYRMERRKVPDKMISNLARQNKKGTSNMEGSLSSLGEDAVYRPYSLHQDESSRSSSMPSDKRLSDPPTTTTNVSRMSVATMEREKKVAVAGFGDGSYRLRRLKPPEKTASDLTRPKKKDAAKREGKLKHLGEDLQFHGHLLDNRNEASQPNHSTQKEDPAPFSNKSLSPPPTTGSSRMSVSDMEREKKVAAAGINGGAYSLKRLKPPERMTSDSSRQNEKDTSNMERNVYAPDNPTTGPSRMSVANMELEKKKASAGITGSSFRSERRKPPDRMTSDFTRRNKKDTSNMEGSLSSLDEDSVYQAHGLESPTTGFSRMTVANMELEKKKASAGIAGGSFHLERRKPPERRTSDYTRQNKNSDMEGSLSSLSGWDQGHQVYLHNNQNENSWCSATEGSLSSLGEQTYTSTRMQIGELEREKKIAAAGANGGLMIRREAPSMASSDVPNDKIVGSGLEQEKNIASSVRGVCRGKRLAEPEEKSTIQPDRMTESQNGRTSYDRRINAKLLSEGGVGCSIESQILTDQMGRAIDLDNEFAFLHSNFEGVHDGCGDVVQEDEALPGAIAVFGIDYDHDDMTTDYVNPDNFEVPVSRRDSAASQVSRPAPIMEENSKQQDETIVPDKRMTKKKMWLLIVATLVIIVVIIAVVVALLMGGDDASEPFPLVTSLPPSIVAIPTDEPMRFPTPSPSVISITESFTIQDGTLGSSLGIANDFVVVSNTSTIKTYELRDSFERQIVPIEQVIEGSDLCISATNRIAVLNGNIVRVYDYIDRSWKQVGGDIKSSNPIEIISISGDGYSIATYTSDGNKERFQIYQFSDTWRQHGGTIDVFQVSLVVSITLNHDGTLFSYGATARGIQFDIYNDVYLAPKYNDGTWEALDAKLTVKGDTVAFSRDGNTLAFAGVGVFNVIAIDYEKPRNPLSGVIGDKVKYDAFWKPQNKLVLAIANDGTRIAFSSEADNVQVLELQNNQWVSKVQLSQMKFGVDSLSFSNDGKLAVGIRDTGSIHIFELDMSSGGLSSEPLDPPSFSPSSSQSSSLHLEPLGPSPLSLSSVSPSSLPSEPSDSLPLSPSSSQSTSSLLEPSKLPSLRPSNSLSSN